MRDFILVYINGREHKLTGEAVFQPITEYIRSSASLCGTKVVCAEGDCGACTVMLGRLDQSEKETQPENEAQLDKATDKGTSTGSKKLSYKPVNACILYGYQVDCCHLITVEGLKSNGALTAVQDAMVECHGAQCGYCTPGFIVAMTALFEDREPLVDSDIKDGLTGNLCRCTGYESIVKAGLEVDTEKIVSVGDLFDESAILKGFDQVRDQQVLVEHEGKRAILPNSLDALVEAKCKYPKGRLVAGGTDLSVQLNKGFIEIEDVIYTGSVSEIDYIRFTDSKEGDRVEVGASVSLSDLESCLLRRHPDLDYIFWVFGSPQIRNQGTLAGNIANGSPIADTLPYLFVMDARIHVKGRSGSREIPILEFYTGYKKLALDQGDGEVITGVSFGLPSAEETLKLYKVSRRQHLDISAFTAAIRVRRKGSLVESAAIAYGGVAATVQRLEDVEEFLAGKEYSLETFCEAGEMARKSLEPLSDVRGSREYRLKLAENIMSRFYYETAREEELACR